VRRHFRRRMCRKRRREHSQRRRTRHELENVPSIPTHTFTF
jgi:hypothetical protein